MTQDVYEAFFRDDVSDSDQFSEVFAYMKELDKRIHKLKKRKKKNGKGKKHKLKNRIKSLELEHEQMRQFMIFTAYQMQTNLKSQRGNWWQEAISSSMPKALELATATINKLPAKNQSQLCLPDGREKK